MLKAQLAKENLEVCSGQEMLIHDHVMSTHKDNKELISKMKVSTDDFEESTHKDSGQFRNKGVDTWL